MNMQKPVKDPVTLVNAWSNRGMSVSWLHETTYL